MKSTEQIAYENETRIEKFRCDKQGIKRRIVSMPPSEQYRKNYDRIKWSKE